MILGPFSGQRSAFSAADAGGENLLDDYEPYAKSCMGVGSMAPLQMSMFLESGHVRYHQFRPNNLPQVLSMSKLGGASSMTQFVVDIPLQLIEVREKRWNENIEQGAARLMEEEIGASVLYLQVKNLDWKRSALMAAEPEALL